MSAAYKFCNTVKSSSVVHNMFALEIDNFDAKDGKTKHHSCTENIERSMEFVLNFRLPPTPRKDNSTLV